jgi:hypothetical protein
MHEAARRAIADVQAGRQVVCTIEEYYTTVRMTLQRYAMAQAAQSHPDVAARITAELKRLDAAQAEGWWPGAYRSVWERLFVWLGRRYAMRRLWRHYYRRAHGFSAPAQQTITLRRSLRVSEELQGNIGGYQEPGATGQADQLSSPTSTL